MKWTSFVGPVGPQVGIVQAERIVPVADVRPDLAGLGLDRLLALPPADVSDLAAAAAIQAGLPLDEVRLLPPIPRPEKVVCIGLNYADHAQETGAVVGDEPVCFNKFPSTLIAHGEPIRLPPESSQVDFEAELVVVIGKTARRVAPEQALAHVGGYMCGHDVSARDWQKGKPGKQWLLGKTFDSFAPCGPWIVSPDEIGDPHQLAIEFRRNGETLQSSSTDQLMFKVDYLVSYLSQVCTLRPGDLIFTGTPSGVGVARDPQVFLQPGDVCEVEIDKLGVLRNPVVG